MVDSKQDVGELLSDCLQELVILCAGGSVGRRTCELVDEVTAYFDSVEKEYENENDFEPRC